MIRNRCPTASLLRFGVFELDPGTGELRRCGRRTRLAPQPLEVLALLAARSGEPVSREEIRRRLWEEGTHVEFDAALNSCVRKIRRALGDSARAPRFLETLPRRGYRFIAPVEVVVPASAGAAENRVSARAARRGFRARALAILSLVAVSLVFVRARPVETPGRPAGPVRLAVLPFGDLALGDAGEGGELFGEGLTEELIARLGRLDTSQLLVIAHSSVTKLADTDKTLDELGRELGVGFLLEGSVRQGSGQARVTARLVRTSDESQVWAESYDVDLIDMGGRSRLAGRLTAALATRLVPTLELQRQVRIPSTSPGAYDAYLKGRYHLNRWTAEGAESAAGYFEQAVEIDPSFAAAHASLAEAANFLRFAGRRPPDDAHPRARAAAEKALKLDSELANAHLALSRVALFYDRDLEAAEHSLLRSLELEPGLAEAHSHKAAWLAAVGRTHEAVSSARLARELDPLNQSVKADLCWYLNYADRFEEAVAECSRSLELEPGDAWSQWGLQESLRQLGRHGESVRAAPLVFGRPEGVTDLRHLVRRRLDRVLEIRRERFVDSYALGTLYALLGEPNLAFQYLESAIDEKSFWVLFMKVDPRLDGLRGDQRFDELAQRAGQPDHV